MCASDTAEMSCLAGAVSDKGKLVNLYFAVALQQDKPVAGISSLGSDSRFVKYLMPCGTLHSWQAAPLESSAHKWRSSVGQPFAGVGGGLYSSVTRNIKQKC